ncbi:hypothetical protein T492DRAFT_140603 [Pavlovales sp. CCMP2436]|nr:hypothetical protein T492DRAFT_140603 [Pavlovales sp. CCMP2436]
MRTCADSGRGVCRRDRSAHRHPGCSLVPPRHRYGRPGPEAHRRDDRTSQDCAEAGCSEAGSPRVYAGVGLAAGIGGDCIGRAQRHTRACHFEQA